MPSSLRIDGWFSRCRDKVQVRARAGREVTSAAPAMFKERCSREPRAERVQERHAMFQRVTPCFRESDLQLARCFSTVQLAPPHGRLVESDRPYGAEPRPCPGLLGGPTVLGYLITFGKDKFYRSLYMYNYAGH